jgi:hypothetical protein
MNSIEILEGTLAAMRGREDWRYPCVRNTLVTVWLGAGLAQEEERAPLNAIHIALGERPTE